MTVVAPPARDARSYPLIEALFARHGFAEVRADGIDAFARSAPLALVVFLDEPRRCKEALDLAVIVPELARAFAGCFTVGVALPDAALALQPRYGFRRWPALVVLREGRYVGAIDGLRGWDEYVAELAKLQAAPPTRAPTIGIAIKDAAGN